ncbi:hypothetical protein MYCTH_2128976 [Thermothelomyces thermophilus ATCC 42464]|uniref:Uncharacterized protein n=1 Tax=Thermothelomyces thermophilus (strain ATCC 42464 / BCRC 31852 / DSM 1799) TaxID=573729 RepID=G2QJX8_THET4|nr:uncharacterized protein MYCTH_2128976 [Thermothelomyces thermophilus ATCC 42464]AEO59884.1 hypothetical protein MYCTH_2128976 [Thermothelomyces thermophilus ATCC 42464]
MSGIETVLNVSNIKSMPPPPSGINPKAGGVRLAGLTVHSLRELGFPNRLDSLLGVPRLFPGSSEPTASPWEESNPMIPSAAPAEGLDAAEREMLRNALLKREHVPHQPHHRQVGHRSAAPGSEGVVLYRAMRMAARCAAGSGRVWGVELGR